MRASIDIRREIDAISAQSSAGRRTAILAQITDLLLSHGASCGSEELALFDDIIVKLAADIEMAARALLAEKLAGFQNAPPKAIRILAFDDAIEVASPV